MTSHVKVHGIVPRIQYLADGTLTEYEFPFAIFKTSDIDVYFGDSKQDISTYNVSETRCSDGGTVIFNEPPSNGTLITIVRNLSIERTTDFQEGGALRANVLNDELDYQIACQQQIADSLNRSMVLPPYASDTNVDLTLPIPSAGKAIVWNKDGTNLENSTVEVNALESTLKGYKESTEQAASTATIKAEIASDKADMATIQAGIASVKAEEVATSLITKANTDMDNLSVTGKEKVAHYAMPSTSYVDLSLGATGDSYIAPANGWINIIKLATAIGQYVALYNTTRSDLGCTSAAVTSNARCIGLLPVSKNDEIICNYDASGEIIRFRFYYAQGEIE